MTGHLTQIHNIIISCPDKEIILFDEDASGVFRHVKLQPQVVASNAFSFGQILRAPIGSVFGANVGPQN